MLNKSDFILLLQESLRRAFEKSPKFFRVWGWINIAMSAVGLIPAALVFLEIAAPDQWMVVVGKFMTIAGIWGKIQNIFVVAQPTLQVMPFTEKKQIEESLNK